MCGIVGVKIWETGSRGLLERIGDSVACLRLRGPDSQSVYKTETLALGHARLAIIDLNPRASQPMADENGRYRIVFNGEIFNFKQIREELEKEGYTFFSESDTEVLLKGYMRWGADLLPKLNGFFAFCIHDAQTDSLFLARDRFGIKPLLYMQAKGRFAFASELKALAPFGLDKTLDEDALVDYFRFSYIPAPRSIYRSVKKLLPGHAMRVSADGKTEIFRWYVLAGNPKYQGISYAEATAELRSLLDASVQRRLVSDVPLGAFLSGGVDSSVIAASAAKFRPDLRTFSIGFSDNPSYDESAYARETAAFLGTHHENIPVTSADLLASLPAVMDYYGEPFADSSALAVHILCGKVRQHVTVALSGDGGDEQFAGYNKHRAAWRYLHPGVADRAVWMLEPVWEAGNRLLPSVKNGLFSRLAKYAEFSRGTASSRYVGLASWSREQFVATKSKQSPTFEDVMKELMPTGGVRAEDFGLNEFLYTDMHWVLPNDMLRKVDLMSMANSLEVRVPLLDHTVAELAFSLPDSYKIDRTRQKKILVDAFRDRLPAAVFERPKHGFEVPLGRWFAGELNGKLEAEYLSDERIDATGLFVKGTGARLRKLAKTGGSVQQVYPVWAMSVFMHWYHHTHQSL